MPVTVGKAASTHTHTVPSVETISSTNNVQKRVIDWVRQLNLLTLMCTIVLLPLVHVVAQIRESHTCASPDSIVVGCTGTCARNEVESFLVPLLRSTMENSIHVLTLTPANKVRT